MINDQRKVALHMRILGRVTSVTDATEFVGKSLVSRLLQTCPVDKIFVLIRGRRGKSFSDRYYQFTSTEIWNYLGPDKKAFLSKIIPLEGDVSEPVSLGIKHSDLAQLIECVNIVFHSAVSIQFNEPLK